MSTANLKLMRSGDRSQWRSRSPFLMTFVFSRMLTYFYRVDTVAERESLTHFRWDSGSSAAEHCDCAYTTAPSSECNSVTKLHQKIWWIFNRQRATRYTRKSSCRPLGSRAGWSLRETNDLNLGARCLVCTTLSTLCIHAYRYSYERCHCCIFWQVSL